MAEELAIRDNKLKLTDWKGLDNLDRNKKKILSELDLLK